ncbi:MAG: thermostable hemolysin [Shewanella algae]
MVKQFPLSALEKDVPSSANPPHSLPECRLFHEQAEGRTEVEDYIAAKYFQVHGAKLKEFLPFLLQLSTKGQPQGAFGLRAGCYYPLFLEQYLKDPIEQQVALLTKRPVDRASLVEVGNLALTNKSSGPLLLVLLAATLARAGFEYMVFTVTEQVEALMRLLGFSPMLLCSADPERLEGDSAIWGNYYRNNPRVMIGDLRLAQEVIETSPRLRRLAQRHESDISTMAAELAYARTREPSL